MNIDIAAEIQNILGSTANNSIIQFAVELAQSQIRSYINYSADETLPIQLLPIIQAIAISNFNQLNTSVNNINGNPSQTVASISDNGQSISYDNTSIGDFNTNNTVANFASILNNFRRMN